MSDIANLGTGLSVLLFYGIILGAVFVTIEALRALDDDRLNDFNAYEGVVGEYQKHELRRDFYFQVSVIAALLAIYMKLPSLLSKD